MRAPKPGYYPGVHHRAVWLVIAMATVNFSGCARLVEDHTTAPQAAIETAPPAPPSSPPSSPHQDWYTVADQSRCESGPAVGPDAGRHPDTLDDQARSVRSAELVAEAQAAHARGDLGCAVLRYEEAALFDPPGLPQPLELIQLAGTVALEAGECTSAWEYFRFVVVFRQRDDAATQDAPRRLAELEALGCAAHTEPSGPPEDLVQESRRAE
jgi:hypothetical protein